MISERKKPSSGHWAAQAKRWNEGERSQTLEEEVQHSFSFSAL
jgi:hypothetical protein